MASTVMYAPDGTPYAVPESEVNSFRRKGFRSSPVKSEETAIAVSTPTDSRLNINTASLKELIALPLVGTAIAKKVISARPHAAIEDLIAKISDVDWTSLESRICF